MGSILPYCYNATYTLVSFDDNIKRISNSMWYQLNVKQQYCIKFLIQYAQQERKITGYGFFVCSLETFLKVIDFKFYIQHLIKKFFLI